MANQYKVIKSNPACGLFEGQTIIPYYDDENEIILSSHGAGVDHHIRKNQSFFNEHLQLIGGNE